MKNKQIVNWIVNGIKIKHTKIKIDLGICELTKAIFTIKTDNGFSALLVRGIFTDHGDYTYIACEEGERCLNKVCSLNDTTWQSYAHEMKVNWMNQERFARLIKLRNSFQIDFQDNIDRLSWSQPMVTHYDEPMMEYTINPKEAEP